MWSLAAPRAEGLGDPTMVGMDAETYAFHERSGMPAMGYMALAKGYFSRRQNEKTLPESVRALYAFGTQRAERGGAGDSVFFGAAVRGRAAGFLQQRNPAGGRDDGPRLRYDGGACTGTAQTAGAVLKGKLRAA